MAPADVFEILCAFLSRKGLGAGLMGLSDGRWRLFMDSFFAKRLDFDSETIEMVHIPIFLKQKIRNGVPLDAKVYSESFCKKYLLRNKE